MYYLLYVALWNDPIAVFNLELWLSKPYIRLAIYPLESVEAQFINWIMLTGMTF